MDKKGWIILVLAVAGLMGTMWWSAQERARWAEEQRLLRESQPAAQPAGATSGDPATAADAATPPDAALPESRPALENIPPREAFEEIETPITAQGPAGPVRYVFTNRGGGIARIEFPEDQVHANGGGPVTLNRESPFNVGALSDGIGRGETSEYRIVEQSATHIVFEGTSFSGMNVRKTYRIDTTTPGAAPFVRMSITLANPGVAEINTDTWSLHLGGTSALLAEEWQGQVGVAWLAGDSAGFQAETAFKGGWFSSAKQVIQGTTEDARWIGPINQFYVLLALPAEAGDRSWWARPFSVMTPGRRAGQEKERTGALVAASLNSGVVAPSAERTVEWTIFAGPKHNPRLRSSGYDLEKVMLYGNMPIFGWIAQPFSKLLNWSMHRIKGIVPDFGVAIVILTILIRFTIWPLHAKSQRTMKRMALLGPKMQELKTKYPDDPQKMNREMMKMYQDYGINPLGGCLPILMQMPIFFGFYRMLQYAAELRHESFLWVKDLSQPDTLAWIGGIPVNALPLLMAGTMILQMKMTPQTGDKMQQRIFAFMPVIFLFICYNFAAALSLYWTTQNIFSIGQSWWMRRQPDIELVKKPKKKGLLAAAAEAQRRRMAGQPPAEPEKPKKNRPPRTGG